MSIFNFIKSFSRKRVAKAGLGAVPSKTDDRDRQFNDYIIASTCCIQMPDKYQTEFPAHVYDQRNSNMCVACSFALVRFIQTYMQNGKEVNFDPLFIYADRKDPDPQHIYYKGEGMSPRDAASIVKNYGDSIWKNGYSGFYTYPKAVRIFNAHKEEMEREAIPYKIDSYYSVNSVADIKYAIMNFGAVSTMFPVYKTLYKPVMDHKGNYKVKFTLLDRTQKPDGYHQMTIIGWDDDCWIVQNSWGTEYGNNGIVRIPMSYPVKESWVTIDEYDETLMITK